MKPSTTFIFLVDGLRTTNQSIEFQFQIQIPIPNPIPSNPIHQSINQPEVNLAVWIWLEYLKMRKLPATYPGNPWPKDTG